jgi:hypothetical protein
MSQYIHSTNLIKNVKKSINDKKKTTPDGRQKAEGTEYG